ncbi:MAG: excinuclease ABC subunit UvrA [bacterium]|uniref:UvrABC system protein A n=1 Tax=Candidatus Aphodosoma intestinipullorum TaxID=2840674 RepID=A0A940DIQ6_9BACT|nr:excinuclease ABC subunit UvrA [Candidatus Aphodosoma intestinipullorum]
MSDNISVLGARVHNLKNVDVTIPRNSLTVITGLSGSGKSSLAFDTIYAEGQRRYIETFSAYARHFMGNVERPDVDEVTGLSPVIAIEQKTVNKNPRSTVGTVTEIYDFLRLLFARAADAYSYVSGKRMVKYSDDQVAELILKEYDTRPCYILAPMVKNRKGHYKELFESIRKKGYLNVRVDGELQEISYGMKLDRYKNHDIEVVVDKLVVKPSDAQRLRKSVVKAMQQGDGVMMVLCRDRKEPRYFSRHLMDPDTGMAYNEPAPHNFSFNTPKGACPKCKGVGTVAQIDMDKIIPDRKLSIAAGGITPLGKERSTMIFWQIGAIGEKYGFTTKTPICDIPQEGLDEIMNGSDEELRIRNGAIGSESNYYTRYDGLLHYIEMQQEEGQGAEQKWAAEFYSTVECPECHGSRLNREAMSFRIADKNIAQLADMQLDDLYDWLDGVEEKLETKQRAIAAEILKEIRTRLRFLLDVGLGYLSLSRASGTLSGGESQRIRLATQIGSQLVNVLYILDEPSIGLHQRDNLRLISSLKKLRDVGNSVVVVEHDEDMMRAADYVVDMGPRAGRLGGNVVFEGTPEEMLRTDTLTANYLNRRLSIEIPEKRREGNSKHLILRGARGNNLKNVTLDIPLGMLVCISGVSGSGKSTLINQTLQPILSRHFYRSTRVPLAYDSIEGIEYIDKVVEVNQQPIGRTPRSNPVTYTGIFNDIRNLFAELPEAKTRGYKAGRFSFNTKGGRCEVCGGNGYKTIEMNFLPDVFVPCEACGGKRYNRETLEVRFKGKSIADVLDMTINQAVEFFENMPTFIHKLKMLQDVGLGYVKLGQSSTTLSGGESQRIKIAAELSKRDTGRTLYILDEPTTGLHFEDIKVLLGVLQRLIGRGNTVIVIEHNLDVLKCADYIIDIGPEAGKAGGEIVAAGTPEKVAQSKVSATAPFLRQVLGIE